MANHIKLLLNQILSDSPFIKNISTLKNNQESRLFRYDVRVLTASEIRELEKQGNRCQDWGQIRVTWKFNTSFIYKSTFYGNCYLGDFQGRPCEISEGTYLQSGIYNSTIIDSEIGDDTLIYDVGLLANYVIQKNAILFHIDILTADKINTFGNGEEIIVGMESGGRKLIFFADLDYKLASSIVMHQNNKDLIKNYESLLDQYFEKIESPFGIIGEGASVLKAGLIQSAYIGPGVNIKGAQSIINSTILSNHEVKTSVTDGVIIKNSCIQHGCTLSDMAVLDHAFLTGHNQIDSHAKVTQTIIGPYTGISRGEVCSSLVGPSVEFNHQALLKCAIWPGGRGAIGHGCDLGCNETAPHQELFIGEGVIFGPGCHTKAPANFSDAPYSIFASGIHAPPQKIDFPFSLIIAPSQLYPDESPTYNEIIPAWLLHENIYLIKQIETRLKSQNKANRNSFAYNIFNSDVVDKMVIAKNNLAQIKINRSYYTGEQIPELGRNILTEQNRQNAIEAYSYYIKYYCLFGLMQRVQRVRDIKYPINQIYEQSSHDPVWEHQRMLLEAEGWSSRSFKEDMKKLQKMLDEIYETTLESRRNNDILGQKIISDYDSVHGLAEKDEVVLKVKKETEKIKKMIGEIGRKTN